MFSLASIISLFCFKRNYIFRRMAFGNMILFLLFIIIKCYKIYPILHPMPDQNRQLTMNLGFLCVKSLTAELRIQ